MKKAGKIFIRFPEYYLILLTFLSGYTPPLNMSFLSIALAIILILQIIFKNKVSGMLIAGVFLLINLYMLFALISEFNEFPEFNNEALKLISTGSLIWCVNMFFSILMIYKYVRADGVNRSKTDLKAMQKISYH